MIALVEVTCRSTEAETSEINKRALFYTNAKAAQASLCQSGPKCLAGSFPTPATAGSIPTQLGGLRDLMFVPSHTTAPEDLVVVCIHQVQHSALTVLEELESVWSSWHHHMSAAVRILNCALIRARTSVRLLLDHIALEGLLFDILIVAEHDHLWHIRRVPVRRKIS